MIKILRNTEEISEEFLVILKDLTSQIKKRTINIALSGGNTPKEMFKYLTEKYGKMLLYQRFDFWWVDERCVPSDHYDSNYKWAFEMWLSPIGVSEENIHRIIGEADPEEEAVRYSEVIESKLLQYNGFPQFDLIILGLGEDGHTASIFPNRMDLLTSRKVCDTSIHPAAGQKRITLTGTIINNASKVVLIATGKSKSLIVRNTAVKSDPEYPASYIKPETGELIWLLDEAAGEMCKI